MTLTVYRVLERLLFLERQRLSYRALNIKRNSAASTRP